MAPSLTVSSPGLSLAAAQHATAACIAKATSMNIPMNIAVVDPSLHLLSFSRMPGAKLTSIDIAINKAYTACGHRVGTHNYKDAVWPGGAAYGIWNTNAGKFTVIGGGLPVLIDGQVVGAIGCSTGTPAQDQQVAQAGVDALNELLAKERGPMAKL